MTDKIIATPDVREMDGLLDAIDRELSAQNVPALTRRRAEMLVEELLAALRDVEDESARLRCAFPEPRTVELRYRGDDGVLEPELSMLRRLDKNPCTEGVSVAFRPGRCTITID